MGKRGIVSTLAASLIPAATAAALALFVSAQTAEARCQGTDLRNSLSAADRNRLTQEAAKVPYAEGNHWIARKNGRQIHVVGTQHSGDARMGSIMRTLRPVIRSADLVLLEVTEAQINAQSDSPAKDKYYVLPKGQRLDRLIGAKNWEQVSRELMLFDVNPQEALVLQPWVVADIVGPPGCRPRGIGTRRGLDDRIERIAKQARIPVAGLESTEAGLIALSGMPLKDQARMLVLDLQSSTNHHSLSVTQSQAYFEEKLTEGRIVLSWSLYHDMKISRSEVRRLLRSLDKGLLDDRNKAWMRRLEQFDQEVIFMAVGAAHLPGKLGVLNLLEKSGWTLERGPFRAR